MNRPLWARGPIPPYSFTSPPSAIYFSIFYFSVFPFLTRFIYFSACPSILKFPFYQNSLTPFPGRMS